ncbi:MAG: pectate lyase [Gemmatimonadetes bacterium]|nr:pectate lyase [Gemmatimonadota bacterium]
MLAPHAEGFTLEPRMTDAWFRGEEARRIAESIVSFQTPSGGWSKRMDFTRPRRPGESWASEGSWAWIGTFDNGATSTQLRYLARMERARPDARWRRAYLRGLDYVLMAQFPTGCWPQVYPLVGSYHDAATFNDDATVNVLRVLREVSRGEVGFVPEAKRREAAAGLRRGVECILGSQVVVDGRPTVWGQQHDPLTLAPVKARAYELVSLTGRESASIVNLLLEVDQGNPRVATAVRGAVQWFRDTALYGYDYAPKKELTPRPGAGPIWARFYEIGTNRPMFSNRDGVVRYSFAELEPERRYGYGWYTDEPATTLRRYERRAGAWAATPGRAARGAVSAVVDARYTGEEGAPVAGVRTYRTIGAALAAAPADGTAPYVISIRDGRYREKLSVEKPNVHFVGQSRDGTVLTYDAAAGMKAPGGWQYGTRGSWTLRIAAPGFRLESMTVENAFDYPANATKPDSDRSKLQGTQAVAVMMDEGNDRTVFRDCRITGYQDTLFPNAGRSWFNRCTVVGSVDFIFGAGVAVFEDDDIVSRDRGSVTSNGYVTAPSTPISRPYGFLFLRSRLKKETPTMAPNSVTLGRPWHPSGRPDAVGSAVFVDTWMDDHVGTKGVGHHEQHRRGGEPGGESARGRALLRAREHRPGGGRQPVAPGADRRAAPRLHGGQGAGRVEAGAVRRHAARRAHRPGYRDTWLMSQSCSHSPPCPCCRSTIAICAQWRIPWTRVWTTTLCALASIRPSLRVSETSTRSSASGEASRRKRSRSDAAVRWISHSSSTLPSAISSYPVTGSPRSRCA